MNGGISKQISMISIKIGSELIIVRELLQHLEVDHEHTDWTVSEDSMNMRYQSVLWEIGKIIEVQI